MSASSLQDSIAPPSEQPFVDVEQRPEITSRFQLVVVASLRSKQLQSGASPRIEADPRKRKNTSIALEEVRQGLVPVTTVS